ncbi:MAG TPA: pitrilysin family protein [Bacillota bacterium]
MTDAMGFAIAQVAPGVEVRVRSSHRFHRTTFALFIEQRLAPDLASATALLPRVLRRGTASYPETLDLERVQADLYGASLDAGVMKVGERHVITVSLTMPAQRYVGEPGLDDRGLALLAEAAARPAVDPDGRLRAGYVAHETRELAREIRAQRDHKMGWAQQRCIAIMCAGEPYGVPELGTEEGLAGLDAAGLTDYHAALLSRHPMTLYAFGPFDDAAAVGRRLAELGGELRSGGPVELPPPVTDVPAPARPRRVEEWEDMAGGWMVLGFRAGVLRADPDYYAMLLLNDLYGGSPHSRLFLKVREQASLAYTAGAAYDANKGIMLAVAGIDPSRRAQAEEMMLAELADLAAGNIGADEFAASRATLMRRLKEREDRPGDLIMANLVGRISGRVDGLDEALRRIAAVTPEQVAAAARMARLDTVYFLGGRGRISGL